MQPRTRSVKLAWATEAMQTGAVRRLNVIIALVMPASVPA